MFRRGPVFAGPVWADEIKPGTSQGQTALLRAMASRK
ncbi:MAG: AAA family ATPase [Actinomycetales bacterium]|nr:AAA family ATPase [Actinomycetales bacterium]